MIPGNINTDLISGADDTGYAISRSLRFNSSDSGFCGRSFTSAGDRKKWTFSTWIKRTALGAEQSIFCSTDGGSNTTFLNLGINSSDQVFVGASSYPPLVTANVFRDPSAWYHFVLTCDTGQASASDRLKFYVNGVEATYSIDNRSSVSQGSDLGINQAVEHSIGRVTRFGSSTYSSLYLTESHFIDSQALDPSAFTEVSATTGRLEPKAYSGPTPTGNSFWLPFSDNSAATATTLGKDNFNLGNNWTPNNLSVSPGVNRVVEFNNVNDFYGNPRSVWALAVVDGLTGPKGAIAAAGTPLRWTPASPITLSGSGLRVWAANNGGSLYINGTLVSVPGSGVWTSFGTTFSPLTSVEWTTVSGLNFFQLAAIEVNGSILEDTIFSQTKIDSLVDTPTSGSQVDTGLGGQVTGNYATLNPLDVSTANITLQDGNLVCNQTGGDAMVRGTIGVSSGKWYWEATLGNTKANVGIAKASAPLGNYLGSDGNGWGYYSVTGHKVNSGGTTAYGATATTGDVIGIAFDADNGTLVFYKNGVSQGTAFTGLTSGPYFPAQGTSASLQYFNFGQRPFAYTAPSGFKALCDTNLPSPQVAKPSTAMDVVLYTGNGGTQTISGLGFSPDLVWIKQRSTVRSHWWTDTVRGNTKLLSSDQTIAEITETDCITAFNSDGFSLDADAGFNANAGTYAAWCWDAGSTTVTNTQGSITSSVRANASAGFSIVTWTVGATAGTVGHGLGVAPSLIITKDRDGTTNWIIYHSSVGIQRFLRFTTAAPTVSSTFFDTAPTSSVFTPGSVFTTSNGFARQVAYCFAPVVGYSSAFTYTGNGSNSGPFVYLGFRPRFTIIKRTDATASWMMYDSARDVDNPNNTALFAQLSDAETASDDVDYLSNGLKLRTTGASFNASGGTYIGFAWAESPFAYSRAR